MKSTVAYHLLIPTLDMCVPAVRMLLTTPVKGYIGVLNSSRWLAKVANAPSMDGFIKSDEVAKIIDFHSWWQDFDAHPLHGHRVFVSGFRVWR